MSTAQSTTSATEAPAASTVPMRFEVAALPVADVERAKAFYQKLGWRLDIDFHPAPNTRGVQFTPPGSPASIHFGEGLSAMTQPHDTAAPPARRWRSRQLPGGFTLGTYFVVEIVCTVALVTAILVMAL